MNQQALLPELQPPPSQPLHCAVMGVLRERARFYPHSDGTCSVQVLITQFLLGKPEAHHVLATYRHPDLGCPHATRAAAQSQADAMRTGAEVIACGSALYPGEWLGDPVLVLGDVTSLRLHNPPAVPGATE